MATDLKVVELRPPKRPRADESVIRILRGELERAERGEIACVAIASVDHDGAPWQSWSRSPCRAALIGSIAELHANYMQESRE
jgi:hypothetical protein